MTIKDNFNITDLFDDNEITHTSSGAYKTQCPDCGLQGGRTEGFILFPENNGWHCHSSGKHGQLLELIALKHGIIKCIDCAESGEKKDALRGELWHQTLNIIEETYNKEVVDEIYETCNLKRKIELPGNGILISKFARRLADIFSKKQDLFFRDDIEEVVEITPNGFRIVKPNRFITLTERYFNPWFKVFTKGGDYIEVNKSMNQATSSAVLVSPDMQDKLKKMKRIFTVPIPVIYDDMVTFPIKGYDPRFESWLNHDTPDIRTDMSLDESVIIFKKMYMEFCFESKQDYVNAVAGLITPFLRGLFSDWNVRTPMFCYMANRERAGKDYCAGITGLVLEGVATEEPPICSGEYRSSGTNDELRKKIVSALISGKKRLHFGNNKGKMNNAVLEGFLTSRYFSDRLLGKNESLDFSNEIDISISGNIGMTFTPDLANRSRFVRLFFAGEDANARKFKNPNLHEWVLENRGEIISAIYGLIRNWIEKGSPDGSIPFASFPEWAKICGGIMEVANIGNPCERDKHASQGVSIDDETDEMKQLFEYVYEHSNEKFLTKNQIKDIVKEEESLMPYIDWGSRADQTKFGLKIDKFVGRILSDIMLIVEDVNVRSSRRKYKFEKLKSDFKTENLLENDENSENDEKRGENDEKRGEKGGNLGNRGNVYPSRKYIYIENIGIGTSLPKLPRLPTSKNTKKFAQSNNSPKTKKKTDRETQFWESEETQDIIPECTKEEVLKELQSSPNIKPRQLLDKLGVGALKFRNELKREDVL